MKIYPGDASGEEPPVPIPNTEVKLSSAEDTWGATSWENRSSPGYFISRSPVAPERRGIAMLGAWIVSVRCSVLPATAGPPWTASMPRTGATPSIHRWP